MKFPDPFRGLSDFYKSRKERKAAEKAQRSGETASGPAPARRNLFVRRTPHPGLGWGAMLAMDTGWMPDIEPRDSHTRWANHRQNRPGDMRDSDEPLVDNAAESGMGGEPGAKLSGSSDNGVGPSQSQGKGKEVEVEDPAAEDADDESSPKDNDGAGHPRSDAKPRGDAEVQRLDPKASTHSSQYTGGRANKLTDCSDVSSQTVQRDPSKRSESLMPSAGGSSMLGSDRNPFSDRNALRNSSANSGNSFFRGVDVSHRRSAGITSETECTNIEHVSGDEPVRRYSGSVPRNAAHGANFRSSDDIVRRIFDNCSSMRSSLIRARAIIRFVTASRAAGMQILEPSSNLFTNPGHRPILLVDPDDGEDEEFYQAQEAGSVVSRLRSARSTMSIKRKKSFQKSLRRIKSLANISLTYRPGALNGVSLEELARLGGHSYVELPREYSPALLKLPSCIASVVQFLARDEIMYAEPYGSEIKSPLVIALYSYYATQILEAENGKRTIESTARTTKLPMNITGRDGKLQEVQRAVGTVFRHLLLGIPGGILGSRYLYRVLKMIHALEFQYAKSVYANDPTIFPKLSSRGLELATLAIVGFTGEMQLELICAVFGLLSRTRDMVERLVELHKTSDTQPCDCELCGSIPGARFLGCAFATLLADPQYFSLTDMRDTSGDSEEDGTDIAVMLIYNWPGICELLTLWEVFGLRE